MTYPQYLQQQINQLYQAQMVIGIKAVAVPVFATIVSALLPQIVFELFYAQQPLLEAPAIFGYIQIGSFAVAGFYFLYAVLKSLQLSSKTTKLEQELHDLMLTAQLNNQDSQLTELQTLVDEALSETKSPKAKKSKTAKKKTAKKTTKRSTNSTK